MSRSPLQHPNRPQQPTQNNQAIRRTNNHQPPRQPPGGGGGNNNGGNNNPPPPSPWLDAENEPQPNQSASFVEYLRWMRPADHDYKDATKVQILQKAQENANYTQRLEQLNRRTQLLAKGGITFQVKSTWRIRVGGHRGPESILLPAFDALGMPYIPSSTLRGVARTQAIREIMAERNLQWEDAEKEIAPYFGDINAKEEKNKTGKVIFFDAYPLPSKNGGLEMDMANNIWSWKDNSMQYSPNPNPLFSLKESTFLIGLRLSSHCQDQNILEKVKNWLIKGLQSGVGSQVNTGYGQLIVAGENKTSESEFYRLDFSLEGQLIHGHQRFTQWQWNDRRNEWQMRGAPVAEVRPIAFKSMMRYWFRVFASGVLPINEVQEIEAELFGGINPKKYGYLQVNILDGKVTQKEPRPNAQGKSDPCGEQQGTLVLSLSTETSLEKQDAVRNLAKHLTWFLANMGGIGQGARRPNYSRQSRERAPWFRGSTFYIDNDEDFWAMPNDVQGFKKQFQQRLKIFYNSLNQVAKTNINPNNLRVVGQVSQDNWSEAADRNCQIFACAGKEQRGKPHALAILHSDALKIPSRTGQRDYNGALCGKVSGGVKPSPVWIADLGDYQIVTVFGTTADPRTRFINELKSKTAQNSFAKIFPLS
jgi:CRISPR-associated protein Cmr6